VGLSGLSRPLRLLLAGGLLVRVVLVVALIPVFQTALFAPFLEHVLEQPSLAPWRSWLDSGGTSIAFPYGPLMLLWFGGFAALTAWLPVEGALQLGIALGVLAADLITAALILRAGSPRPGYALALYAVSPIAVYASFVHGQLDVFPTALMFASLIAFRRRSWSYAGLFAGLAIAAKASSLLLSPFAVVFLLRNNRYRSGLRPYLLAMLPGVALFLVPAIAPGYRDMVLATPETRSVVEYAVAIGPGLNVVALPVVFVVLLAMLWRYRRANPDIVLTFTAVALLSVALLTPASPGWYVWSAPFLALVAAISGTRVVVTVLAAWVAVTVSQATTASNAYWRWATDLPLVVPGTAPAGAGVPSTAQDLFATAAVVTGAVAVLVLLRSALRRYDTYRLSQAPLSVAVAGDSGTGKDTLCISLANVFSESATSFLLGDDYHLYERHAPLWSVTTHLDPAANDLPRLTHDTLRLLTGEPVWCRHYDHERGKFTKYRQIAERELVVVSGLHALTVGDIRENVDLTVFTDMEESLRRRLKIERDVGQRGHQLAAVQASIERRLPDRDRYILPQQPLADVTLRLESEVPLPPEELPLNGQLSLRVVATLRGVTFAERLSRAMVGIGGCYSRIEYLDEPGVVEVTISPSALSDRDVESLARHLLERPEELFVGDPVWLGGSQGVMQLVLVLALVERRRSSLRPSYR